MARSVAMIARPPERLSDRLIESLYTESMLLADEARAYFEDAGRADRDSLDPLTRVGFSCESLKLTTRLMHMVAWLLVRRDASGSEIEVPSASSRARRLSDATDSDPMLVARLPVAAQTLIGDSQQLYARVKRLEDGEELDASPSPARMLMNRLERSI